MALVLSGLMAACLTLILVAQAQGVQRAVLLFDAAHEFGIPPYAGLFSNVGVLALTAVAAICLFTAAFAGGWQRRVLWLVGILSALLAMDDLFMFHDWLLTDLAGIPEEITLAFYGVLVAAILAQLGRAAFSPDAALIWVSLGLLALSVLVDLSGVGGGRSGVLEEMTKLCGFVVWVMFWTGFAHDVITERSSRA